MIIKTNMNGTNYTVYWMVTNKDGSKAVGYLETIELRVCLKTMESLRKLPGVNAITMCAEHGDQVGKMGVDAVVDGILPDGQEYVYKTERDRGR